MAGLGQKICCTERVEVCNLVSWVCMLQVGFDDAILPSGLGKVMGLGGG